MRHYPTMTLATIKALPVPAIAAPDSVLLLWVVDTHLEQAFEVLHAWGFTFKTVAFYWRKLNRDGSEFMGLGHYTRANPEQCWLATRRRGLPVARHDVRRLISAPRGRHSAKPPEARTRIEQLFGQRRRVELFARERAPGWESAGNEVDGQDLGTRLAQIAAGRAGL